MLDDFFFAWEGAADPNGPWAHLRVLEVHGTEAISAPYSFEIELVKLQGSADVDVADLVGRPASLRIVTLTDPPFRLIHGIIGAAEELGDIVNGDRIRVTLVPPIARAAMMRKSVIYLDKTLEEIIEQVLTRQTAGAALARSIDDPTDVDDGDPMVYVIPTPAFAWRILRTDRLLDREARPYCVQYDESDFDFVSRLLEEEGISYHFEHTRGECVLVLTDHDGGRLAIDPKSPIGAAHAGREMSTFAQGSRLRPRSVWMGDYNWKKPALDLWTQSPATPTGFPVFEYPGRYEHSRQTGDFLAERRVQQLDTERHYAVGTGRCRLLGAGALFQHEHTQARLTGAYVVTSIRHHAAQRGSFGQAAAQSDPYVVQLDCLRCGPPGGTGDSNFRPPRVTPRPRIVGSQTALVVSEPSAPNAEIHVGGDENIGCVRLQFGWDIGFERGPNEPSSCWVRVSQMFAGAGHGAMWHPRVGNEVIVEFLDGDPDRPIVTGRVYNGVNPAPENATARPTFSAIKSLTSPFDGNYNMLAFEDLKGQEEITLHAARDFKTNVKRDASRRVGSNDRTTVEGDQEISVTGGQKTKAAQIVLDASERVHATAPLVEAVGKAVVMINAPVVYMGNGVVVVHGSSITVAGDDIAITGGTVKISGGSVDVTSGGTVNVNGATVNLNCA